MEQLERLVVASSYALYSWECLSTPNLKHLEIIGDIDLDEYKIQAATKFELLAHIPLHASCAVQSEACFHLFSAQPTIKTLVQDVRGPSMGSVVALTEEYDYQGDTLLPALECIRFRCDSQEVPNGFVQTILELLDRSPWLASSGREDTWSRPLSSRPKLWSKEGRTPTSLNLSGSGLYDGNARLYVYMLLLPY